MKKNISLLMHLPFAVIVLVELLGRLLDRIHMEYYVKPLIMVWIALYFLLFAKKKAFTIPVLAAFFFSWTGDNFLMLSGNSELFFYAGVGGFFCAQLAYVFTFIKFSEQGGKGFLQKKPWITLFFLAYLGAVLFLLFPGLEGMMKAVITIYALSLILMSMMALNRRGRVGTPSFGLVFTGSLFFLLSDSMIAIDKFYGSIPLSGFLIMITYITAQYLIMRGLILQEQ